LLLEIFADRGDLAEDRAVLQFECRALTGRIDLKIALLPVLAAANVDILLRQVDPLLRREHPHHARVRPDRIVELHETVISLKRRTASMCGSRLPRPASIVRKVTWVAPSARQRDSAAAQRAASPSP